MKFEDCCSGFGTNWSSIHGFLADEALKNPSRVRFDIDVIRTFCLEVEM